RRTVRSLVWMPVLSFRCSASNGAVQVGRGTPHASGPCSIAWATDFCQASVRWAAWVVEGRRRRAERPPWFQSISVRPTVAAEQRTTRAISLWVASSSASRTMWLRWRTSRSEPWRYSCSRAARCGAESGAIPQTATEEDFLPRQDDVARHSYRITSRRLSHLPTPLVPVYLVTLIELLPSIGPA